MSGTTAGPAGSSSSSTCAARIGEASATQDGGGGGGGGGGSASDVSLFGASDSNAATTLRAPRPTRSRPVTSSGGPWNPLCLTPAPRTLRPPGPIAPSGTNYRVSPATKEGG